MNHSEDVMMVLDPSNKTLVNVKPLFDLQGVICFDEAAESVDSAIRALICSREQDDIPVEPSALYFDLFEIRNMFKRLTECAISVPEKKGGKQ